MIDLTKDDGSLQAFVIEATADALTPVLDELDALLARHGYDMPDVPGDERVHALLDELDKVLDTQKDTLEHGSHDQSTHGNRFGSNGKLTHIGGGSPGRNVVNFGKYDNTAPHRAAFDNAVKAAQQGKAASSSTHSAVIRAHVASLRARNAHTSVASRPSLAPKTTSVAPSQKAAHTSLLSTLFSRVINHFKAKLGGK